MPFTTYFDQKLVGLAIGQVAYVVPATLYVALSTSSPAQSQAGTPAWNFSEPIGNSYARVPVPNTTANWGPASPQPPTGYSIANKVPINYQQSSAAWMSGAALGFFGLFDAPTGGNLLLYGPCSPAQTVDTANITLSFAVGALTAAIN